MKTALQPCLALLLLGACIAPPSPGEEAPPAPEADLTLRLDLSVSSSPFTSVECEWKQRLDQPYVFVEHLGSYTETGGRLGEVISAMRAQGLVPAGPPFALFYDDPGRVPAGQLRSRACVPVAARISPTGPLAFDLLPSTTVVYAYGAGPYPEIPRMYPGLYRYMAGFGWVEDGPIREIYLVDPGSVSDFSKLVTEVQIPVRHGE